MRTVPLMPSPLVAVRVPASLSGFGADGGCLGLALDSWSTFEVWPRGGEDAGAEALAPARRVMRGLWEEAGFDAPEVALTLRSDAGTESSIDATDSAVAGALLAANEMAGRPMGTGEMLNVNSGRGGGLVGVAAALLGGLQLAGHDHWNPPVTAPVPMPMGLTLVIFLPDSLPWWDGTLPDPEDRWEWSLNPLRMAMVVSAMASDRLEDLAGHEAMQPGAFYPEHPAERLVFTGAMIGGALAVVPANGGLALVALTRGREMTVAYEMAEAARQAGLQGAVKIAKPSTRGAYVVKVQDGAGIR